MKKLAIIGLCTLSMAAMDDPSAKTNSENEKSEKTKYEISESCHQDIQKINKDGGTLYYFFKGVFKCMGETADISHKPSHIIDFFAQSANDGSVTDIDSITKLVFMPATAYLNIIVKKHYGALDAAFMKKYDELAALPKTDKQGEPGAVQMAWEWFDGYFKQKGLEEPFAAYKKTLIQTDAIRLEFAQKGVPVRLSADGSTIFFS
jgi:hypothetical protein